jgi:hypothetical protein
VATSLSEHVADLFAQAQRERGVPAVVWIVQVTIACFALDAPLVFAYSSNGHVSMADFISQSTKPMISASSATLAITCATLQ